MGLRHIRWAEAMIKERGLAQSEVGVLRALADKTNNKVQSWTISHADLAKLAGCEERTVRRATADLEQRRLISVKRRRGRGLWNTYRLNSDQLLVSTLAEERVDAALAAAVWAAGERPHFRPAAVAAISHLIHLGVPPDDAVDMMWINLPTVEEIMSVPGCATVAEARAMLGSTWAAECDRNRDMAAQRLVAAGGRAEWIDSLDLVDQAWLGGSAEELAADPEYQAEVDDCLRTWVARKTGPLARKTGHEKGTAALEKGTADA